MPKPKTFEFETLRAYLSRCLIGNILRSADGFYLVIHDLGYNPSSGNFEITADVYDYSGKKIHSKTPIALNPFSERIFVSKSTLNALIRKNKKQNSLTK